LHRRAGAAEALEAGLRLLLPRPLLLFGRPLQADRARLDDAAAHRYRRCDAERGVGSLHGRTRAGRVDVRPDPLAVVHEQGLHLQPLEGVEAITTLTTAPRSRRAGPLSRRHGADRAWLKAHLDEDRLAASLARWPRHLAGG
jgi:hypothetical protein